MFETHEKTIVQSTEREVGYLKWLIVNNELCAYVIEEFIGNDKTNIWVQCKHKNIEIAGS